MSGLFGEVDQYLFSEGTHRRLWEVLGVRMDPTGGAVASVWAPNATAVSIVGDWNQWGSDVTPLERVGDSGVWAGRLLEARIGQHYQFEVCDRAGQWVRHADPMARRADLPPATASVISALSQPSTTAQHRSTDRRMRQHDRPMSFYEVHLSAWGRGSDGHARSAHDIAAPLVDHVTRLGFTHVELMPVSTHPFGGSWGYQVTGYYAPDARLGTPDDLRFLVDALHDAGIEVVLDWVPAHFPRDSWALARFDGTPTYEHPDPRRGEHPDWGTLVFDHGRGEVRSFLISNALYWLESFDLDGLRVDAVASMLYLDYSRNDGEWAPNIHGGRENLEAVEFLRMLTDSVHEATPGALVIAEESTAWPGVTTSTIDGGLGFDLKWNLGWMHDTLRYLARDPVHRHHHQGELEFPLHYAFDETWVLPLSHDEVVHGKRSMARKFPGDDWQRLASLRLLLGWQWILPGSPLLFMGAEFALDDEFADERGVPWDVAAEHLEPGARGIAALVTDLNALVADRPALWRSDADRESTWWLRPMPEDQAIVGLVRRDTESGACVVVVMNATPVPRHGTRIGVPGAASWREVLSTDDLAYGGSGVTNELASVDAEPWQGHSHSMLLTLPPLGIVVIAADS